MAMCVVIAKPTAAFRGWNETMRRIPFNIDLLRNFQLIAQDTETTGLHWYENKAFGLAIAAANQEPDGEWVMMSKYFDLRDTPQRMIRALGKELCLSKGRIVNHNMKFDAHFLREAGFTLPAGHMECTSVREALIDEHRLSYSLDAICKDHLGEGKTEGIYEELASMFGGKPTRDVQMKNLHRAPVELASKYATPDPELAIKLWIWQEKEINRQGLEQVWDLERRLMPVLIDMEKEGVAVDVDQTERAIKDIDVRVDMAQDALNKLAGKPVNANSPVQMRALFKAEKGEDGKWRAEGFPLEETDAGNPSMDADVLRSMVAAGSDRARHVLSLRKLIKGRSFLKDHIMGHQHDGRVYPNYNQTKDDRGLGTGTGRFSVDDPALQQIPARDVEVAEIVRACFIPDPGDDWVCSDWEQFEFRWFAHYTKDEHILETYRKDPSSDFHKMVAGITGLPRSPRFAGDANAKQINLGLVFGMGQGKLAAEMGLEYTMAYDERRKREWLVPGERAKEVFKQYHEAIPGVSKLLESASAIARSRGYVRTVMGRHIRFPRGQFVHKAAGLVFQGSSADCIKYKMIEMHRVSGEVGFRMRLSVHDELDFSVPKGIREEAKAIIKKRLETFDGEECPILCRVPILAQVAHGPNWWEASK